MRAGGWGRKPGLSVGRIGGQGASAVSSSVTVTADNCPGDATPFTPRLPLLPPTPTLLLLLLPPLLPFLLLILTDPYRGHCQLYLPSGIPHHRLGVHSHELKDIRQSCLAATRSSGYHLFLPFLSATKTPFAGFPTENIVPSSFLSLTAQPHSYLST